MGQLRKARNRRVIIHVLDNTFHGRLVRASADGVTLTDAREVSTVGAPVAIDGILVIPASSILFAQVL